MYSLIHYTQCQHSLALICGDGDIFCGDGDRSDGDGVGMGTEAVGMGTVFTETGRDGVQFLSPCRPLN